MVVFRYRLKHTPQSVCHCRGWVQQWNVAWLVFINWVISYANEWEDYSNYFWEGAEVSRIWATANSMVFRQWLGTVTAPLGVSFHLLIWDQGLVCLPSWSHLILSSLCLVLGLCHSFKSCALPLSLLLQFEQKEMQKSKMALWGGLPNSCEKKRSQKQRGEKKDIPIWMQSSKE